MAVVTFIFGLCGAGKSELATEMKSDDLEIEVLDEDSEFSAPANGSLSPEKYARLQEHLRAGKNCAVVEATLFFEPLQQQALTYLIGIPDVEIKWVGFENDPDKANFNCTHRDKRHAEGHIDINNRWTKILWKYPAGTENRLIQSKPCGKGPACSWCNPPKEMGEAVMSETDSAAGQESIEPAGAGSSHFGPPF
jgi:hypothetical protein